MIKRKISYETLIDVYDMIKNGFTNNEIMNKHKISRSYISLIRTGKSDPLRIFNDLI